MPRKKKKTVDGKVVESPQRLVAMESLPPPQAWHKAPGAAHQASSDKPEEETKMKELRYLQEMFSKTLDPVVVHMMMEDCDYQVDVALETLFKLAEDGQPENNLSFKNVYPIQEDTVDQQEAWGPGVADTSAAVSSGTSTSYLVHMRGNDELTFPPLQTTSLYPRQEIACGTPSPETPAVVNGYQCSIDNSSVLPKQPIGTQTRAPNAENILADNSMFDFDVSNDATEGAVVGTGPKSDDSVQHGGKLGQNAAWETNVLLRTKDTDYYRLPLPGKDVEDDDFNCSDSVLSSNNTIPQSLTLGQCKIMRKQNTRNCSSALAGFNPTPSLNEKWSSEMSSRHLDVSSVLGMDTSSVDGHLKEEVLAPNPMQQYPLRDLYLEQQELTQEVSCDVLINSDGSVDVVLPDGTESLDKTRITKVTSSSMEPIRNISDGSISHHNSLSDQIGIDLLSSREVFLGIDNDDDFGAHVEQELMTMADPPLQIATESLMKNEDDDMCLEIIDSDDDNLALIVEDELAETFLEQKADAPAAIPPKFEWQRSLTENDEWDNLMKEIVASADKIYTEPMSQSVQQFILENTPSASVDKWFSPGSDSSGSSKPFFPEYKLFPSLNFSDNILMDRSQSSIDDNDDDINVVSTDEIVDNTCDNKDSEPSSNCPNEATINRITENTSPLPQRKSHHLPVIKAELSIGAKEFVPRPLTSAEDTTTTIVAETQIQPIERPRKAILKGHDVSSTIPATISPFQHPGSQPMGVQTQTSPSSYSVPGVTPGFKLMRPVHVGMFPPGMPPFQARGIRPGPSHMLPGAMQMAPPGARPGGPMPMRPTQFGIPGPSMQPRNFGLQNRMLGRGPQLRMPAQGHQPRMLGPGPQHRMPGPGPHPRMLGPGPQTRMLGPGTHPRMPGPVPSHRMPGPGPQPRMPGPGLQSRMQGPGPHPRMQGPGPHPRMQGPGPQSIMQAPGLPPIMQGPGSQPRMQGPGPQLPMSGPGNKPLLPGPGLQSRISGPIIRPQHRMVGLGNQAPLYQGPEMQQIYAGPGSPLHRPLTTMSMSHPVATVAGPLHQSVSVGMSTSQFGRPHGQSEVISPITNQLHRPAMVGAPCWPLVHCNLVRRLSDVPEVGEQVTPLPSDKKVMCLMRGCPGSGKSTLARQLNREKGVIYSTDDYFASTKDGSYKFDPRLLADSHKWNQDRALQACKNGISPIIIDNTNTQSWEMKPYVATAVNNSYQVEFREPMTPWKNKPNQLAKKNSHGVPMENLEKMVERYEHNVSVESILYPKNSKKKKKAKKNATGEKDDNKSSKSQEICNKDAQDKKARSSANVRNNTAALEYREQQESSIFAPVNELQATAQDRSLLESHLDDGKTPLVIEEEASDKCADNEMSSEDSSVANADIYFCKERSMKAGLELCVSLEHFKSKTEDRVKQTDDSLNTCFSEDVTKEVSDEELCKDNSVNAEDIWEDTDEDSLNDNQESSEVIKDKSKDHDGNMIDIQTNDESGGDAKEQCKEEDRDVNIWETFGEVRGVLPTIKPVEQVLCPDGETAVDISQISLKDKCSVILLESKVTASTCKTLHGTENEDDSINDQMKSTNLINQSQIPKPTLEAELNNSDFKCAKDSVRHKEDTTLSELVTSKITHSQSTSTLKSVSTGRPLAGILHNIHPDNFNSLQKARQYAIKITKTKSEKYVDAHCSQCTDKIKTNYTNENDTNLIDTRRADNIPCNISNTSSDILNTLDNDVLTIRSTLTDIQSTPDHQMCSLSAGMQYQTDNVHVIGSNSTVEQNTNVHRVCSTSINVQNAASNAIQDNCSTSTGIQNAADNDFKDTVLSFTDAEELDSGAIILEVDPEFCDLIETPLIKSVTIDTSSTDDFEDQFEDAVSDTDQSEDLKKLEISFNTSLTHLTKNIKNDYKTIVSTDDGDDIESKPFAIISEGARAKSTHRHSPHAPRLAAVFSEAFATLQENVNWTFPDFTESQPNDSKVELNVSANIKVFAECSSQTMHDEFAVLQKLVSGKLSEAKVSEIGFKVIVLTTDISLSDISDQNAKLSTSPISSNSEIDDNIPIIRKLDQSTMTEDLPREQSPPSDLLDLRSCFPNIPVDDLQGVLDDCLGDVEWATNILMDSEYTCVTPSTHISEECTVKKTVKEKVEVVALVEDTDNPVNTLEKNIPENSDTISTVTQNTSNHPQLNIELDSNTEKNKSHIDSCIVSKNINISIGLNKCGYNSHATKDINQESYKRSQSETDTELKQCDYENKLKNITNSGTNFRSNKQTHKTDNPGLLSKHPSNNQSELKCKLKANLQSNTDPQTKLHSSAEDSEVILHKIKEGSACTVDYAIANKDWDSVEDCCVNSEHINMPKPRLKEDSVAKKPVHVCNDVVSDRVPSSENNLDLRLSNVDDIFSNQHIDNPVSFDDNGQYVLQSSVSDKDQFDNDKYNMVVKEHCKQQTSYQSEERIPTDTANAPEDDMPMLRHNPEKLSEETQGNKQTVSPCLRPGGQGRISDNAVTVPMELLVLPRTIEPEYVLGIDGMNFSTSTMIEQRCKIIAARDKCNVVKSENGFSSEQKSMSELVTTSNSCTEERNSSTDSIHLLDFLPTAPSKLQKNALDDISKAHLSGTADTYLTTSDGERSEQVSSVESSPKRCGSSEAFTDDDDDVTGVSPCDVWGLSGGVVLQLDVAFALQLQEMFGPVGFHLSPDGLSDKDLEVKLSHGIARQLHTMWASTLQERFDQEQAQMEGMIQADEQLARKLQQEEEMVIMQKQENDKTFIKLDSKTTDKDGTRPMHTRKLLLGDYTRGQNSNGASALSWQQLEGEKQKQLQEIIDEEVARLLLAEHEAEDDDGKVHTLAAKIKRKQLYQKFPTTDKSLLDDIFSKCNYDLTPAIRDVQKLLSAQPPPQDVYTDEELMRLEKKQLEQAAKESLAQMQQMGETESIAETLNNPSYHDYRAETTAHYRQRHECFQKAAAAYQRGLKDLASFYSRQGHKHTELLKAAHSRALESILETRHAELDENVLDLHGLHVEEAVKILAQVLRERSQPPNNTHSDIPPLTHRPRHLLIITGRGKNSRGGVAKIKPAVANYLKSNHYRFTIPNAGLIKVLW